MNALLIVCFSGMVLATGPAFGHVPAEASKADIGLEKKLGQKIIEEIVCVQYPEDNHDRHGLARWVIFNVAHDHSGKRGRRAKTWLSCFSSGTFNEFRMYS